MAHVASVRALHRHPPRISLAAPAEAIAVGSLILAPFSEQVPSIFRIDHDRMILGPATFRKEVGRWRFRDQMHMLRSRRNSCELLVAFLRVMIGV